MIEFDSDKNALFNPNDLGLPGSSKKALMVFDDEVWEDYLLQRNNLDVLPVKNNRGRVFSNYLMYKNGDEDILLISPNTGASASVMDLELLIASGIQKIVSFGTCGAMDKNIAKNTVVIPESAFREEGTSYHYLAPGDEIYQDQKSIQIMSEVFTENDIEFLNGKVWTTDAVYRETIGKLESMKNKGCVAVDMELSALLAVSQFRNIEFASFLITDDNIDGKNLQENERNLAKIFQMALNVVNEL